MRTASTVREILVPKTQLLLSGAPGVKVGFKVMGEDQAVTGRLACGGPSGLASGPRQGPMQQGRPLSIPPAKHPTKVWHTEPLVTAAETGCTYRAEHTGDGPGDPRDGGRASGG